MAVAFIPLDKAYLTAIWLETLLYGINVCLFCSYVYILRFRRARKITPIVFWVAVFMFCFSTIHVSLGFCRLIWGFIDLRNQPGGPGAYFSDVSTPPNVAKVTIHSVNSILGDSIVVWRCWHVWGGEWRVCVLPILLIIASAVCGFSQAVIFAEAKTVHSAFANELERWNGSLFSLSLVTNVVVTTLIAARIWFITRESGGSLINSQFRYTKVLVLIIESAMVYSAALVIEITLYFCGSNAFYIVYDPIAQLTGIVPTTIIVMSVLGLSAVDFETNAATRRERRTMQMSTMHFENGKTTVMSLPGLGTDNTTSGGSYPTTNDSTLAIGKESSQMKLPEVVESRV
ncbi:hypothetical protein BD309DRAFT_902340 [Dichomitus squalens]|uniref:Uncharacterized protein n=1 Tax=Dichomitus squalens TaxID=114155 RepID=A0A4Q9NIR0_9APHY|nr:hypothetical protein BD311DRAFT_762429 [Dichomitus squalens]TBU39096.1 hypothetical protein BD309DRAFT_902340 [Dichomitus squalens]